MGTEETIDPPLRLKDRYRLIERLGEGSMGFVYQAHDETLDRDVAIKFLLPERLAGGEASTRFLREARAIARLSHPNIMTLYDVGREDAWHYLVLEHIPGQDLHTLMIEHSGPLPIHEALHAARGALSALAYAHARDIVHRDVKPENIMVTPDGQVKVTDFGLALARGDVRLTKEGMIVGTVLYLAPEVLTGTPADYRADLYAVGAVLYELLTGQPPFTGEEPMAIFSQILNTPVTSPRALDSSIPTEVEHVVVRLLAKDPADRYGSAEEVLAALPGPTEAEILATVAAEQITAERASLSLLERIVRSSSTTYPKQEPTTPVPDEETLLALPGSRSCSSMQRSRTRSQRWRRNAAAWPVCCRTAWSNPSISFYPRPTPTSSLWAETQRLAWPSLCCPAWPARHSSRYATWSPICTPPSWRRWD
jgi:serine/threonine protein kinase